MAMQYDVRSTTCAANGTTTVFGGPARIKGILINYTAATTLTLNDGTAGTAMFTYTAPAGAAGSTYILVPGEGIRCITNISGVCSAGLTATVFYG